MQYILEVLRFVYKYKRYCHVCAKLYITLGMKMYLNQIEMLWMLSFYPMSYGSTSLSIKHFIQGFHKPTVGTL